MSDFAEKFMEIARQKRAVEEKLARLRDEYERELAKLTHQYNVLNEAAQILGYDVDAPEIKGLSDQSPVNTNTDIQKWSMTIGDAVERVLGKSDGPMKNQEIYDAIQRLGVYPNRNSFRGILSGDSRFVRIDTGIYDLASRQESNNAGSDNDDEDKPELLKTSV